jgi:hypothetical protein
MAFPGTAPKTCAIKVNLFDGSRLPLPASANPLFTIRDGNQNVIFRDNRGASGLRVDGLPFYDNFGDRYTVVAYADGHEQAGFTPVNVVPNLPQNVDLMLLGKNAGYNFSRAKWTSLATAVPALASLFAAGAESADDAANRYTTRLETKPDTLACLLNITTAMSQIHLPVGTPLDYFRQLNWDDTMKQDRFFGFADPQLVEQVQQAAHQGLFAPELGTFVFHPGATTSYKQIQFGEANVQITFHENDRRMIDGVNCVLVEPDIDYYKDVGAHALLEVIPNGLTGALSDPRQVYVLRWIAGRHAGVPEFDPLYTIE